MEAPEHDLQTTRATAGAPVPQPDELDPDTLSRVAGGTTSEEVRNVRQMDSTSFQSFDEQTTQSMNLLSSVMKTTSTIRTTTPTKLP